MMRACVVQDIDSQHEVEAPVAFRSHLQERATPVIDSWVRVLFACVRDQLGGDVNCKDFVVPFSQHSSKTPAPASEVDGARATGHVLFEPRGVDVSGVLTERAEQLSEFLEVCGGFHTEAIPSPGETTLMDAFSRPDRQTCKIHADDLKEQANSREGQIREQRRLEMTWSAGAPSPCLLWDRVPAGERCATGGVWPTVLLIVGRALAVSADRLGRGRLRSGSLADPVIAGEPQRRTCSWPDSVNSRRGASR